VVNLDGSGRTPLVKQSFGTAGKLDWSPDGSRILFHDNRDRLFTIKPDGTELTELARGKRLCAESFSPDGAKLLVLGNCGSETDSYLLTMNVDGTGLKRIPNTIGAHWASWGGRASPARRPRVTETRVSNRRPICCPGSRLTRQLIPNGLSLMRSASERKWLEERTG
jgi:Tol biopolymer transport system component